MNLSKEAKALSCDYRAKGHTALSKERVDAYLVTRYPATAAALKFVFEKILESYQEPIHSMVDIGAGPGTGVDVALNYFPLQKAIAIEKSLYFIEAGKQRLEGRVNCGWVHADLEELTFFPTADLLLFSYSLGELHSKALLRAAWDACQLLVIVEPGTPAGFERIRQARQELIEWGGQMVAPCPHANTCPMQGGNWCHFATRLARTALHRTLKEGSLGYEDEKFSYIAIAKGKADPIHARILRHPQKHKGHIQFSLCAREGLQEKIVSKRDKEAFHRAKKSKWGDSFDLICP